MEGKGWELVGKRVFIRLLKNQVYQGDVVSEDDIFISIIDKFGQKVVLNKNNIETIKEEVKK